jgi:hypothetical protein
MEIISAESASIIEPPEGNLIRIGGFVGPMGSSWDREASIEFNCPGHVTKPQGLSLYVVVKYHDIFKEKRETHIS